VFPFSENTGIDNKSIEDFSLFPFPTKIDDEILSLIGDGSMCCSAFLDMRAWPI
jgi:hypothetical protein